MWSVIEMDSGGNVTAVNTFGAEGLVSRHTAAGRVFYTFDPQGNVAQRLDSSQNVLGTLVYDGFGTLLSGTQTEPWGYNGQSGYYTDTETGLILCTLRYYDPAQGRWLNRDPIGYAGGINLYGYVGNGPIGGVDPRGLAILGVPDGFWVGAGVAALIVVTCGTATPVLLTAFAVGAGTGTLVSHYGRDQLGWQEAGRFSTAGAAVGTLAPPLLRVYTPGCATVTQWAPTMPSSVGAGWVMLGGPSRLNYLLGGIPDLKYPFENCATETVAGSDLSWPSGWEAIKGVWGQRLYTPGGCD